MIAATINNSTRANPFVHFIGKSLAGAIQKDKGMSFFSF